MPEPVWGVRVLVTERTQTDGFSQKLPFFSKTAVFLKNSRCVFIFTYALLSRVAYTAVIKITKENEVTTTPTPTPSSFPPNATPLTTPVGNVDAPGVPSALIRAKDLPTIVLTSVVVTPGPNDVVFLVHLAWITRQRVYLYLSPLSQETW